MSRKPVLPPQPHPPALLSAYNIHLFSSADAFQGQGGGWGGGLVPATIGREEGYTLDRSLYLDLIFGSDAVHQELHLYRQK